MNSTTIRRLGALALAGIALTTVACSTKEDRAAADAPPVTVIDIEPAESLDLGSEMPADDAVVPTSDAPVETAAPAAAEPATPQALMPDVICMNLQDAQDRIQDAGVWLSLSQDATGEDRMQVMDSNWEVVAQFPAPGTPIGEGDAMLDVVKYGEPSPC